MEDVKPDWWKYITTRVGRKGKLLLQGSIRNIILLCVGD
jgi:hypothetical protein